MAAASTHDLLLPRAPGGLVPGAVLALLAHAAMIVALTTVVNWRASAPEAVTAELWSAVPQVAAPAPPPPAPAPAPTPAPPPPAPAPPPPRVEPAQPDPQIAIAKAERERERERQERADRERQARDKQQKAEQDRADKERARKERELQAKADAKAKAEAEAKKAKAEEERLAQQRQKNLDRLMGQVGNSPTSTTTTATAGTAAQSSGPSASYAGRLVAAIKPNIVFTEAINGNPAAEVEVRAGPSGSIIARRIVRNSGNKEWDEAVLRAIDRTSSLPRDVDGRVPATITMVFRPQE